MIAILVLGVSFLIVYFLKIAQRDLDKKMDSIISSSYGYSVLISLIIGILNYALRYFLVILTHKEKRETYSSAESEVVFKITLAYFLNMCLVVLICTLSIYESYQFRLWNANGVAP